MITLPSKMTFVGHSNALSMLSHLHSDVPIEILGQKYIVMAVRQVFGATAAHLNLLEVDLECVL